MQIYQEDGTTRELEDWEVAALEAAQKAHDDAAGIVRQYAQSKADAILTGILANMADIPAYDAVRMLSKYPAWEAGASYSAGWRVRWGDQLYTVLQAHVSQVDWKPDAAPSLFAKVLPGQQVSEQADSGGAGEWEQPDSTNPYMKGDRVTYQGKEWVSTCDNNVWAPGVYGWGEVA